MTLSKSKVIKKNAVVISEPFKIPLSVSVSASESEFISELPPETDGSAPDFEYADAESEEGFGANAHANANRADILTEREKEIDKESIKKEIEEITGRAQAQAQRTADLIISHTLESARVELGAALQQGYSDGFDAGRAEALGVIGPALDKIKLIADSITQAQDAMLEEFRDEMFNIIAEISRKILRREIDEKDEYLIALFEDAVKDIKTEEFVTVTVSESQTEFVTRNINIFKSQVANIEDFKIIPDKNAARGTMIVETAKTVADASFAVQMDEIEVILNRMKEKLSEQALDEFDFGNGDGDGNGDGGGDYIYEDE